MATSKPKDGSTNVGKKALTPSNSHTRTSSTNSTQKASSSSSLAASPDNNNQKQVPNYLKPTISSRPNSFKNPKNQDSHSNKPTLNRRRSLDKPPSPSGSLAPQKASAVAPERAGPALRNSSFSSKNTTTSSLRTLSSKTPRAAKPQTLYAKSTKKSTESSVWKEKGATKSSTATKASSPDDIQVVKVDDDHDQEMIEVTPGDELIKSEASSINQDHGSDTDHDHDQDQDQDQDQNNDEINKLNGPCDISTVSEELVQKADLDDQPDIVNNNAGFEETSIDNEHNKLDTDQEEVDVLKPEDHVHDSDHETNQNKLAEQDHGDDHPEGTNDIAGDDHDHDHQEAKADEHDQDQVVIKEEDIKSNEEVIATEQETGDDQESKTTDIVDNHDHNDDHHQKEGEDAVVEEVAKTAEAPSAGPVVKRQGKKESQAYNDVIEETASKLLEKRKNKVKALVGAFETVIDYESAAK